MLSCCRNSDEYDDKDSMLSLLDKIDQRSSEIPQILEMAEQVAKDIANSSEEVQLLFKDILSCFGAKTMVNLLLVVTGIESVVVLMLIQLNIPKLQSLCQDISEIPLSSFTSLASIRTYLEDMRDYGGSSEIRGNMFVLGNTAAGKTSFARTLKEFSENSKRYYPKSFLTENTHFEKTRVMELVKDIKLTTDKSIITKPDKMSEQLVMTQTQAGQESKIKPELNLTFTDFGGKYVKINKIQSFHYVFSGRLFPFFFVCLKIILFSHICLKATLSIFSAQKSFLLKMGATL